MNRIKTALTLLLLALLGTGERSFADSQENTVRTIVGTRIACVQDTQVAELVAEMSRHGPLINDTEVIFQMPKGCWFVQSSHLAMLTLQTEIVALTPHFANGGSVQNARRNFWLLYTYFVVDYDV